MMTKNIEVLLTEGLIGFKTKIIDSKNKDNIGICGEIIDETRNMMIIKTKDDQKKIIKEHNTFEVTKNNNKITIDGKHLIGRPEERIKKWLRSKKITRTLE